MDVKQILTDAVKILEPNKRKGIALKYQVANNIP